MYCFFLVIFYSSATADDDKIKSNVFVLVDYSTSYYHPQRIGVIGENINKLTSALTSKSSPKTTALIQPCQSQRLVNKHDHCASLNS